MKKDPIQIAKNLIELIGEKNISSYTNCMTRFRVKIIDQSKVKFDEIKSLNNVMGIVENGNEIQIILGPGFVRKVADEVKKQYPNIKYDGEVEDFNYDSIDEPISLTEVAAINKNAQKQKNTSSIQ